MSWHLGPVTAVNGFSSDRGTEFMAYAVPPVAGEGKRHFRDQGWDIRLPRPVRELRPEVDRARADLTQARGRSPRVGEVAER